MAFLLDLEFGLSPVLSALMQQEFPRDFLEEFVEDVPLERPNERAALERFFAGLEQSRLIIQAEAGNFSYAKLLIYLEAVVAPGTHSLDPPNIELVASCVSDTWKNMTDIERTRLWQESNAIYAAIKPLVGV